MRRSWRCRVVDAGGRIRVVERAGTSERELARALAAEGLSPVECVPVEGKSARRLSSKEVLQFTEELDLLFAQSLSLKDAVRVLGTIKTSDAIKALVADLEEALAKGQSMAQALAGYGSGFPPLYLGLVRVGELTGTLKTVLPQLTAYLEDRKRLRDKLLGSLMYPALILCVLVVGMALLTAYVLPTFIDVAESLSKSGAADIRERLVGFQAGFAAFILAVPACALLVVLLRSRREGRAAFDRILLGIPLIGGFMAGVEMRKVCFALETLLESGYTADVALAECVQVCGNRAIGAALAEAGARTTKGERLSRALRETGVLPETFCSWIAVGEEAHDLTQAFKRLRSFYDREFDKASRTLMALMEPALILAVGAVLFAVVIQFIGPIYGLLGGVL
jgi:type II secretory pathway component PulF